MRGALFYVIIAIMIAGCASPVAKQWYADCLAAGYDEGSCRSGARNVNMQVWGNALQGFGSAVRANPPPPSPASSVDHISTRCRSSALGTFQSIDCTSVVH